MAANSGVAWWKMERAELALETLGDEHSRRQGDSAWHTGLCGRPTSDPRSEAEARVSELQPAVSQQGCWYAYGQDGVRSGRGAEPEMGALPMPKRGAADIPSDHGLATRGAHQSRDAISGNQ